MPKPPWKCFCAPTRPIELADMGAGLRFVLEYIVEAGVPRAEARG
jgi:hypothetical protein